MSRMDEQYTTSEIAGSAPALPLSAGQWLRQARERAGMDLGVLSALIKVPVRQLQALEADQHDQLMGTAFVRSLTVTICRHLNVEPQPALDLLPGNVTRLGPQKDSLGQADAPQLGGLFHGRGFAGQVGGVAFGCPCGRRGLRVLASTCVHVCARGCAICRDAGSICHRAGGANADGRVVG